MTEQRPIGTPKTPSITTSIHATLVLGLAAILASGAGCASSATESNRSASTRFQASEVPNETPVGGFAGDLSGGAIMTNAEVSTGPPGPGGPSPREVAADMASDAEISQPQPESGDAGVLARPTDGLPALEVLETASMEQPVSAMRIAELDRRLQQLAAEADDPMRFEVIRALLTVLAFEELELGQESPFSPTAVGLLAEEEASLEAINTFAQGLRRRLATGDEASTDILVEELESLLIRLQNDDGLALGSVEICSSIRGFGDVVTMPRRMATGEDQVLLIYAELEGLEWAPTTEAGQVGWQIEHRLELHQLADDMVIDPGVLAKIGQQLAAPVDDSYFWIQYTLPAADLKAGRYVLKLWVREPGTGREVERSLPIDLLPARLITRASEG